MPTYEYVCEGCGHSWDAFQSIKDDALTRCPQCAEEKARRVISGGMGFILKGGGWYSDLYASPKAGADKGESSSSSENASSSSDTKTDTQSETKSETKTGTKSETKKASKPSSD